MTPQKGLNHKILKPFEQPSKQNSKMSITMGTTKQHSKLSLPHLCPFKHCPKPRQNFEECEGRPRVNDPTEVEDKD